MKEESLAHAFAELKRAFPFPEPDEADEHGLLAWGGDLRAERLLAAYAAGVFPWYEEDPILWFSPDPRWILRPSELRVSRSLAKTIRRKPFELRVDTHFESVIRSCAAVPRPGQAGTWITDEMVDAYCALHRLGFAHCVEAWQEGELVGGCYGVALGRAFFGESMFARKSDASKCAFASLVDHLAARGFELIDCQVHTEHLERFGARAWPRARFLRELERALEAPTLRGRWQLEPAFDGAAEGA